MAAENAEQAAQWAKWNANEWSSDPPTDVSAESVELLGKGEITEETKKSLPWGAGELPAEMVNKTIQWWLDQAAKEGT